MTWFQKFKIFAWKTFWIGFLSMNMLFASLGAFFCVDILEFELMLISSVVIGAMIFGSLAATFPKIGEEIFYLKEEDGKMVDAYPPAESKEQ